MEKINFRSVSTLPVRLASAGRMFLFKVPELKLDFSEQSGKIQAFLPKQNSP